MAYRTRILETRIADLVRQFPAIVLTGPRQAGKTFMLSEIAARCLPPPVDTVSFDTPSEVDAFRRDPDLFFANHNERMFLDEVQHCPDIFPFLKREVDRTKGRFRFLISGSQAFTLMKGVTESMAGRAAILDLWPFACVERCEAVRAGTAADLLRYLRNPNALADLLGQRFPLNDTRDVLPLMLAGGYPPMLLERRDPVWLSSYRQTYLDRDIRQLSNVHDLGRFDRFLTMVAARTAQVLNKSLLAAELGVDNKTIDHWLSMLETSYQVARLQPWFANIAKRQVKRPKYHFADIGLALHLVAIRDPDALLHSAAFGHFFETFVAMEVRKLFGHCGEPFGGWFWRANEQVECGLVIPSGAREVPVEIKHAAKLRTDDLRGIRAFHDSVPESAHEGVVISMNAAVERLTPRIWNLPLGLLLNGLPPA
jgi:predicted AAA+ superfamily ATPase